MKNIWKLFGIIILVAMTGFMVSCSTDADDEFDSDISVDDIINKWYDNQANANAGGDTGLAYEFQGDFDFLLVGVKVGKYAISGNTITVTGLVDSTVTTANFSMSDTRLFISNAAGALLTNGTYYRK